ncbi:unnamed protein product [Eruca vesicaria subsp. sativa]|uniref:AB hydrolase-1 domain-containing protein n=1 Tax=Eruca vesicaria subsp. sativa TaxID=29727 RepID=A0ABC8M9U6_ERUVS|nr:unnamed protein product [Eruca vesicaria subsp. sativa]
MSEEKKQQHFVMIHGSCHGGWCWYKVKPLLEAAGHRVTALDLAASGIDLTKSITEISTFEQYSEPLIQLIASLPSDEKVVLVGHSLGGMSIAMATDKFPDKISALIFVAGFMPDTKNSPSFVVDKFNRETPPKAWLGSEFKSYGSDNSGMSLLFSTDFLKQALYHLSPIEDIELMSLLKRPGSMFINDLSKLKNFSDKGLQMEDLVLPSRLFATVRHNLSSTFIYIFSYVTASE